MDTKILKTHQVVDVYNTPFIGNQLPCDSFIGFETTKLQGTEVVWLNRALLEKYGVNASEQDIMSEIIDSHSYVVEGYTDKSRMNTDDKKPFFADRYGSAHQASNGGSARCGLNGHFQIKGIGNTPLLGDGKLRHQSHGKLFIEEAISEAIWGEICNEYLPYGAIRTLAIIKTNTKQGFANVSSAPQRDCALAVREIAVRPAHFERCPFFWPEEKYRFLHANDADRVSRAIPFFELSSGTIIDSFKTMIDRFACQIAASRIKGIPHGSLTSSSVSIDGRFTEFATITSVPDFGNYVLANGVGAVWDDHKHIETWLANFITLINRCSNNKLDTNQIEHLSLCFSTLLYEYENLFLLDELGIKERSEINLRKVSDLKEILKSKERKVMTRFSDYEFRQSVLSEARKLKLDVNKAEFPLRDAKYHSIGSLQSSLKKDYDYKSVDQLIRFYLEELH